MNKKQTNKQLQQKSVYRETLQQQQSGHRSPLSRFAQTAEQLTSARMKNYSPEAWRDRETARRSYSINAPVGTGVWATEPNFWSVRAEDSAWERRASAEPQPCGLGTWGDLQPWSMPCLLPLGQCSSRDQGIPREEAHPRLAQGSVGWPWAWQRDSSRGQGEPGSWAPAFCPGSQKPEALVGEEAPLPTPAQPVLQQPPCIWGPRQGSPPQEAQASDPGHAGQCGQPASPRWWTRCPVFSALLEWIHCPVLPFLPGCCPAFSGTREP